jgi:hypothetical protein
MDFILRDLRFVFPPSPKKFRKRLVNDGLCIGLDLRSPHS